MATVTNSDILTEVTHSMGTLYFGQTTSKKSVTSTEQPPSPVTSNKLKKIRERPKTTGIFCTLPTQVSEISQELVLHIVNQLRMIRKESVLDPQCKVSSFQLEDCKKSSGDLSTTCRVSIQVEVAGDSLDYCFIAKLLPPDDPCRLYCFEANVFEKEISIYFELLPCLRQVCLGQKELETFFSRAIPQCIYANNNQDGVGVLVFECALQQGFVHPANPAGLSLEQVSSVVKFMAKFHAIGSVKVNNCPMKVRYPDLLSNVYSSQTMVEGARKMFEVYIDFLKSVPGQEVLVERFQKHCMGEESAKQMYSCMRREVKSPFNTIVHGELWEKNMLFRVGDQNEDIDCVVLDWKNAKIASATKDLAFLLLSSTTNQLRSEFLEIILKLYYESFCDTLKLLDVNLSEKVTYEEFYTDYELSTKGAFMQAVCVLVQEMQFLGNQLTENKNNMQEIADTLAVYESRALNVMNDPTLLRTHFY